MRNSIKFLVGLIILVLISKVLIANSNQLSLVGLKEINYQKLDTQLEVIIEVEGEFKYETFGLAAPSRLVIDFWPIQKILVEPYTDIHDVGVLRIRVGEFQPQVARVVFDLAERIPSYRITQVENGVKVIFWLEEVPEKKEEEEIEPQKIEEVGIEPVEVEEEIPKEVPKKIPPEIIPVKEIVFEKTENTFIGMLSGMYNVRDDRFKEIFKGSGFIYGFGLSQKIYNFKQHYFNLSLDFKFYSKKGKATVTEEETKLTLRPISFSGTYMFVTKRIIPFAEIGLDHYSYREESTIYTTSGTTSGFHLQGGMFISLPVLKALKVKLYVRYSNAKTMENDLEVNLGGIEYGMGIVYGVNIF
ncbi:MAG: AMIN domain-containing protein [Candidatus Aminicenantia bacterium]